MFGRKKSQQEETIEPEDGVKAVCGYKDSQGEFWETYEKAVESTKKHKKREEERDMVKEVTNYVHLGNLHLTYYDVEFIFKGQSKEIYTILHKHYSKEGL